MDYKSDTALSVSSLNIVKQSGRALSHILYSKFGCVATFEGVDFESDVNFGQQKRQTVAPEKRFSVKLRAGVEVSVWKADLTNFKVEAVVNAANSHLHHGGGLAQALCEAAGPQIQIESDNYKFKHGPLPTGEAIVANAGLLPCKKIIHAVGPQLSYNPYPSEVSRAEPLLKKTIMSILQKATEYNLDSVAIPAISSGLFNYPLSDCAKIIVSTVKDYYERLSHRQLPTKIFFVNNDEPTVKEMYMACRHILGPNQSNQSLSYSQAAERNTRSAAKTANIQIGSVFITLKSDKIEDQKVKSCTVSQLLFLLNSKLACSPHLFLFLFTLVCTSSFSSAFLGPLLLHCVFSCSNFFSYNNCSCILSDRCHCKHSII